MKYHVQTLAGRWLGGFQVRKDQLAEQLLELQEVAALWNQPLVATRLDGKRRGDTVVIEPKPKP